MSIETPLPVAVVAEQMFPPRLSLPVRTLDGGWLISFQDQPEVILLDSQLRETERLNLGAQEQRYVSTSVALSRDGRFFAVSGRTDLRIVNRNGEERHYFPHTAWDSFTGSRCCFDLQDRLWHVRCGEEQGIDECLTVLEPESGAIVAEQVIENGVGYFDLYPCPDDESVLIDVGCGQDGSYLYLATHTQSGLGIVPYPFDDRVFTGGFAPNGQEFVTGAHHGDACKVHSFPDGQVLASVDAEELFGGEELHGEIPDSVGYEALFLDDNHLLVTTRFGRMALIDRRTMRTLGAVWPPGSSLQGCDDKGHATDAADMVTSYETGLSSLHAAGEGRVLAVYNESVLQLLNVSPLLSLCDTLEEPCVSGGAGNQAH